MYVLANCVARCVIAIDERLLMAAYCDSENANIVTAMAERVEHFAPWIEEILGLYFPGVYRAGSLDDYTWYRWRCGVFSFSVMPDDDDDDKKHKNKQGSSRRSVRTNVDGGYISMDDEGTLFAVGEFVALQKGVCEGAIRSVDEMLSRTHIFQTGVRATPKSPTNR